MRVSVDKRKGIVSSKVDGCDVGCVKGFNPHDNVILPCIMEFYYGEEPTFCKLLSSCPLVANEKPQCRVRPKVPAMDNLRKRHVIVVY